MNPVLKRANAAEHFPKNTDPSSRHAHGMGEAMVLGKPYPMMEEERAYCGESILSTVASLYEARAKIVELEAYAASQRDAVIEQGREAMGKQVWFDRKDVERLFAALKGKP